MPLKFRKQLIADERYESADAFDVDGDGILDIVSGAFWYKGPDFTEQYPIGEIRAEGEYFDDFCTVPLDINGNGRLDFITGGWWGLNLRWRENPGEAGKEWPEHVIAQCGNVETARAWDIDGDGRPEIIPNTPSGPVRFYKLKVDEAGKGTGEFDEHLVFDRKQGHGLGCGDINGNGRLDIVLDGGWLEAPEKPCEQEWIWHPEFDLGRASVPILVTDVNGDGLADIIVGGAHRYGLEWYEQALDGDKRTWIKHDIDPCNSQYHDMFWVDIDGDGQNELVTGKRYRAHNGKDPGAKDDVGIYYFKWTGESFAKQVIDYGPARQGTGVGIHFAVKDLNGNGRLDIVAPGKDGLYVFWNEGLTGD